VCGNYAVVGCCLKAKIQLVLAASLSGVSLFSLELLRVWLDVSRAPCWNEQKPPGNGDKEPLTPCAGARAAGGLCERTGVVFLSPVGVDGKVGGLYPGSRKVSGNQ